MNGQRQFVVFTDLDGTLLDPHSYSVEAARPALKALEMRGVPVVFCTSKTRAEVEAIREELGNREPFIVENGGAVHLPAGYFPFRTGGRRENGCEVISLGVPYREVTGALRAASAATGCPVRGFHEMTPEQIALACGLTLAAAERAKRREYDEPFEILTEDGALAGALLERIEQQGLSWTRGGRFYHVRGRHNKGGAAALVAELYRRDSPQVRTVAVGDGPNDVSMLRQADIALVVRGPEEWNRGMLRLLEGA